MESAPRLRPHSGVARGDGLPDPADVSLPPRRDPPDTEPGAPEVERLRDEVARLRGLVSDLGSRSATRRRLVAASRELKECKRRARLSDALTAAVSVLREASEPEVIFSQAASALEARGFRSILWHVDGDALRVQDIRFATEALRYLERISGASAIGYRATLSAVHAYRRAVETRGPVYMHDGVEVLRQILDDSIGWVAPVAVRVAGLRRAIVAPLIRDDEVTALFVVMDDDLEPSDCPAVGAFAELISSAAQRADLLAHLEGSLIELSRAQDSLLQSQKMQAVGLLAGGIAHDFNNLLTAVVGAAEMLGSRLAEDPDAMEDVEAILGAANRAARLIRQLLAFSGARRDPGRPTAFDAHIRALQPLLSRTLEAHYRLEMDLDAPDPVSIDPSHLEQIIVNLVVNARDAMPEGGTISLRTRRDLSASPAMACLTVTDEGSGISEADQARIFEPFFTTKALGNGTGLGLSVVYGLVDAAGGTIEVSSEEGAGASFVVRLPVADAVDVASSSIPAPVARPAASMRLLLVEDDASVADVLERSLEQAGHCVRRARSVAEGRRAIAEGDIDLVVSDVRLGDGVGLELLEPCEARGVPVIFCSGYLELEAAEERIRDEGLPFLRKPFSVDELLDLATRLLDSAGTAR